MYFNAAEMNYRYLFFQQGLFLIQPEFLRFVKKFTGDFLKNLCVKNGKSA